MTIYLEAVGIMKKETSLRTLIKEGFTDVFYVWYAENKLIFKDQAVMILFFLLPFGYPLIYGFIYNNEVVRDAALVVVDQDDTYVSREYTRRIDASSGVKVVKVCDDEELAKRMLDKKEAYGYLVLPSTFSADIYKGKQAHASLFSDMSCLLYYKAFRLVGVEASVSLLHDLARGTKGATTDEQQAIYIDPVPYEMVSTFNPQNGFAGFILPAILIFIIHQSLILGISMLGGTHREKNTLHTLVPIMRHNRGTFRIVFGKALAYFMIYIVVTFWCLVVVPKLFVFPSLFDLQTLILFCIPYLFACIFLAMFISCFIPNRESPMVLLVFTSLIFLFISGISWPKEMIPWYWKAFSYLLPATPGIQGFVRINTTGALLYDVSFEYQLLWVQTGFYFMLTFFAYRRQVILSHKKELGLVS